MSQAVEPRKLEMDTSIKRWIWTLCFVGFMAFIVYIQMDKARAWQSYLTSFFFFTSLAVGGIFFAALQHVTKSGWSVTIRRVSESLSSFLPVVVILSLILIVFGSHDLFEWLHKDVVAKDAILQKKQAYLNMGFYVVRTLLFLGLWIFLGWKLVGHSLKQDETGDEKHTLKSVTLGVVFLLVFALSYSLFSVDHLMSLHPHWFSTIFGVYCFAGLFQSTLSFIILLTVWLMKKNLLNDVVNENHLHDLGKLLFAFTVFYAYIAFSQFMLIWYANLPEETIFYLHRAHGGWMGVSLSLLVFKFIVPFLVLSPRGAKRNAGVLVAVSILMLVMQYVDIYWLVYPNFHESPVFSFSEIGIFAGMLGLFLLCVTRFMSKHSIVAHKDPRMEEALHHHI